MKVIGTITATTTKNNADTAVPFSLTGVPKFYIQVSSDGYVNQGSSTVTATSADAVVSQYSIVEVEVVDGNTHIAYLPISGASSTLKVIKK